MVLTTKEDTLLEEIFNKYLKKSIENSSSIAEKLKLLQIKEELQFTVQK